MAPTWRIQMLWPWRDQSDADAIAATRSDECTSNSQTILVIHTVPEIAKVARSPFDRTPPRGADVICAGLSQLVSLVGHSPGGLERARWI